MPAMPALPLIRLLCLCALPLAAHAAPPLELRVTGRIVPDACVPSFIGGGVVDYGVVPSSALSAGSPTLLSRKSVGLNVSCAMPTSVGIRLLDNRTVMPTEGMVKTSLRPSTANDERYFGLKNDEGKAIGGYLLRFETGDNVTAPSLELSADARQQGGAWRARKDGMLFKDTLYTWSTDGRAPARMQQMDATLSVQAVIDGAAGGLRDDIPLDGSTTLELVYF
ncbi:DUF1120 domain-containing protein [Herbaspirillum sp. LeCh32-8]|uniref:DUF1120 domain-containing protein n=1 Tax=Herbaspirillum sp. LeCh32-8 TaxID=2821356 RepID=UPI001AE2DB00|nr:DUF1120 domain-containing protein [Herbaspirillum sp. LeCh32-8]MBP0596594.1 DUF1120 domain-containing protein [Herbaspirillum sp. LeCh32-8]